MQIRIFTVPIVGGEEINDELNKFLSTHRIIDVQNALVADKYWTFCLKYIDGMKSDSNKSGWTKNENTKKIDYKELLSEEEFARFSALRSARKKLATDDAIPAFAVFTDAELAEMSRQKELTLSGIKSINGVGKGRLEHYGDKILALIEEMNNLKDEAIQ